MEAQIKEILKENRVRIATTGYGRAINSLVALFNGKMDALVKNKELADDELTEAMRELQSTVNSLRTMKLSHPDYLAIRDRAVTDIVKVGLRLTAVRDEL